MFDGEGESHWLVRIIGGIIIAGAAFGSLYFWDPGGLPIILYATIAAVVGLAFVLVGGNLLDWLTEMDWWI